MPEITVISGKGGTGKTSLTAAFAHLAENAVLCDLDVDAPDLHLILHPEHQSETVFVSGHEAVIDPDKCEACDQCRGLCRFEAISEEDGVYRVDPLACEGCKVCVSLCPVQAIDFPDRECGRWFVSQTRFGPLVHALLYPGQENSGLLISVLRKKAKEMAEESGAGLILADGTPGIGCPVISSLTGTDLAVVVTEPTLSGRHDMERVLDLADHFRIPAAVIINHHDLNPEMTASIKAFCAERGLEILAQLPHDHVFIEAMVRGQAVTEYSPNGISETVGRAWSRIVEMAGRVRNE